MKADLDEMWVRCGRCQEKLGGLKDVNGNRQLELPSGFVKDKRDRDEVWRLPPSRRGLHAYHHVERWHLAGMAPGKSVLVPRPVLLLLDIGRRCRLRVICPHCDRPNDLPA